MTRRPHRRALLALTSAGLALLATAAAAVPLATPADGGDATALAAGVLVAPVADHAFVADRSGRIAAVDLDDGRPRWVGPARGRPLAVHEGDLWVLAPPERAGELRLLRLDPASGAVAGSLAATLPPDVLASPFPQPASRFEVLARADGDALHLHWQAERWPLRGALLEDDGAEATRQDAGVLALDARGGSLVAVAGIEPEPWRRPDLPDPLRTPGLPGPQFVSADGDHVLTATPVTDDPIGLRWRWQLSQRNDGRVLGGLLAHYPMAPFLLRGSTLIWREEPVLVVGTDGRALESGLRLQAADLATGRLLWSFDLADPVHRLPPPP